MVQASRDLHQLNPLVKQNVELFLSFCKKKGLKVGISETYRTIERQDYLYSLGRTEKGAIVTNAKGSSMSSYHQWGLAVDFYQDQKGLEYECGFMEQVGMYGEQFGFEWGGRWKNFKDVAHLQMPFGLSIQELKGGSKVENQISSTYASALTKLVKQEIIEQPGLWYQPENMRRGHIESLIIKVAANL